MNMSTHYIYINDISICRKSTVIFLNNYDNVYIFIVYIDKFFTIVNSREILILVNLKIYKCIK